VGNEANAAKLVGACTYSGGSVSVVKFFSWAEVLEWLTVRAQASVGPTQRNIYRRDLHANVRYVGGSIIVQDDTTNSLVLTFYKMDGSTLVTFTLSTMKAGNHDFSINDDSPPGEYTQDFAFMGSQASSPIAVS